MDREMIRPTSPVNRTARLPATQHLIRFIGVLVRLGLVDQATYMTGDVDAEGKIGIWLQTGR